MIGQQHLLAKTHNGLILLKIGIGTWEVGVVSNPNPGLGSHYHIVIDQLDEYSVLIHDEHEFVRGKLVGDGIVFSPRQEFNIGYLKCEKLAGHLLHGCNSWKVYKIDLNTMTKESVDLPIPSGDVFLMFGYMVSFFLPFFILFYFRTTVIFELEIEYMLCSITVATDVRYVKLI
jgi:hypothetical protein